MENQAAGGRRQAAAEKLVRRLHENGWLSIPTERDIPEHQFRFLVGQVLQAAAQVSAGEGAEPAGAFDALLASYNTAALFVQYRNHDGSVTLTAAEAERVGAKVTAAIKGAAAAGFPWLVMLGKDQIVAGFFSEVAAAAYINLSREPGKYSLVNRSTGAVDGTHHASSVATMADPPSLAGKPKAQAEASGSGWDSTLEKIRELSRERPGRLEPGRAAWLETLFAKLRGMEWVVVDKGFNSHCSQYYVGAHRERAAADLQGSYLPLRQVIPIDEVLAQFEQLDAEKQTG